MKLSARLAADLVVVVHASFVAFVLFSQILVLIGGLRGWNWVRNPWFRVIHLACIGFVVFEAWCGITCPLTTLEDWLRREAGDTRYQGDFIAHWVHELLFFDWSPKVFTIIYSTFGATVLAAWWWVPPRRRTPALTADR